MGQTIKESSSNNSDSFMSSKEQKIIVRERNNEIKEIEEDIYEDHSNSGKNSSKLSKNEKR
jgi:hypothetical protein